MDNGNPTRTDNGNGVAGHGEVVLILKFTPATFRLEIDGTCANADVALAAMEQARRYYEGELRKVQAVRMQQDLQRLAEDNRVAAALRKH